MVASGSFPKYEAGVIGSVDFSKLSCLECPCGVHAPTFPNENFDLEPTPWKSNCHHLMRKEGRIGPVNVADAGNSLLLCVPGHYSKNRAPEI